MIARVIKLNCIKWLPILELPNGDRLVYSKLTNDWVYSTLFIKAFFARKRAEEFLNDWGFTIDKS